MSSKEDLARTRDRCPAVVLDTNVALDWLVFGDASVESLARCIETGALRWIVCLRMRNEIADVLARPAFASHASRREHVLTLFDRLSARVEPVARVRVDARLLCADPDDQPFVDLALSHRARWLFTRDKALLALAAAARRAGLEIFMPAARAARLRRPA